MGECVGGCVCLPRRRCRGSQLSFMPQFLGNRKDWCDKRVVFGILVLVVRQIQLGCGAHVVHVATNGSDVETCGISDDSACKTVQYAVDAIANDMEPSDSVVQVVIGSGTYGATSCGASATRPLNISGSGSDTTVITCNGTGPFLASNSSVGVTGVSIVGGIAGGQSGGVMSVDWTTQQPEQLATLHPYAVFRDVVIEGSVALNPSDVYGAGVLFVAAQGTGTVSVGNCTISNNTGLGTLESGATEYSLRAVMCILPWLHAGVVVFSVAASGARGSSVPLSSQGLSVFIQDSHLSRNSLGVNSEFGLSPSSRQHGDALVYLQVGLASSWVGRRTLPTSPLMWLARCLLETAKATLVRASPPEWCAV